MYMIGKDQVCATVGTVTRRRLHCRCMFQVQSGKKKNIGGSRLRVLVVSFLPKTEEFSLTKHVLLGPRRTSARVASHRNISLSQGSGTNVDVCPVDAQYQHQCRQIHRTASLHEPGSRIATVQVFQTSKETNENLSRSIKSWPS